MTDRNYHKRNRDGGIVVGLDTARGRWADNTARELVTPRIRGEFKQVVERYRELERLPPAGPGTHRNLGEVLDTLPFPRFHKGDVVSRQLVNAFNGNLGSFLQASEQEIGNIPRIGPVLAKVLFALTSHCNGIALARRERPRANPDEGERTAMVREVRAFAKGLLRGHNIQDRDGRESAALLREASENTGPNRRGR